MDNFLFTMAGFGVFFVFMAVGVIFSDRRIKGSCGGIGQVMGNDCKACDCGKQKSCG